MDGGITWNTVFPIVATIFGILASALMGMAIAKLNGIESHLQQLNGKVFAHLTQPGIHESAVVKLEEQIKNLLQVSQALHARVDRLDQT